MVEPKNKALDFNNLEFPIARDGRGRNVWKTLGGSPGDNLRLGVNNVRGLLCESIPELVPIITGNNQVLLDRVRRIQTELFILDKIRSDKDLRNAIVHTQSSLYSYDYRHFGSSLVFTLAISLRDWGLFEDSLEQFMNQTRRTEEARKRLEHEVPPVVKVIDPGEEIEFTIRPLNQKDGRDALARALRREIVFGELSPIYITDLRKRKHNPSGTLYIGRGILSITVDQSVYDAYEAYGALLAVPQADNRYQWLAIYGVEPNCLINLGKRLSSFRINIEAGRMESHGWYGPELQSFLDYMAGKIKVQDPSELPTFTVNAQKGQHLYFGRAGRRYIGVTLHEKTDAATFLVVPKYHPTFGYRWIDGYEGEDNLRQNLLFTRRILPDDANGEELKMVYWKGQGVQCVVDWAYGRIPISQVGEIKISMDQENKYSNLFLEDPNLSIGLESNSAFDKTQPVYLVPCESGVYKWLEVQQEKMDQTKTRRIVSVLLLESSNGVPRLIGRWQGPARQAVSDYIDGKVDASHLQRISAKLGNKRAARVCQYNGRELTVALRSNGFSINDEVDMNPSIDEGTGNLVLEVSNKGSDRVLARATYNPETNAFNTVSLESSRRPKGFWTAEVTEEEYLKLCQSLGVVADLKTIGNNSPGLLYAIQKYPGGLIALRQKLEGILVEDGSGRLIIPIEDADAQFNEIVRGAF